MSHSILAKIKDRFFKKTPEFELRDNINQYRVIFASANHTLLKLENRNNNYIRYFTTATKAFCGAAALSLSAFFGIGIAKHEQAHDKPATPLYAQAHETAKNSKNNNLNFLFTLSFVSTMCGLTAPLARRYFVEQNTEIKSHARARAAHCTVGGLDGLEITHEAFTAPNTPLVVNQAYKKSCAAFLRHMNPANTKV